MMLQLFSYMVVIFFITSDVYAQNKPVQTNSNEPLSEASQIMQNLDFNSDGKISEKEFIVFDGNTGYRTH